ncbi:hypothetical protein TNIN_333811 [Trichonephila inaurata madagascariensis]|uniref:Uncharacterized protein n=1 Tax=Trichonephila inaurata madagascariensis TaxID=2747483 RepID=A0A8X7CMG5_9ARAC|nr:hypothetical protein TNIN_333811 [Trichonephila inaurata madagascariensis]
MESKRSLDFESRAQMQSGERVKSDRLIPYSETGNRSAFRCAGTLLRRSEATDFSGATTKETSQLISTPKVRQIDDLCHSQLDNEGFVSRYHILSGFLS